MRQCTECGNVTDEENPEFCPSCGARFGSGAESSEQWFAPQPRRGMSGKKFLVLLLVAALLAVGLMQMAANVPPQDDAVGETGVLKFDWTYNGNHHVELEYDKKFYADKIVGSKISRGGGIADERYTSGGVVNYAAKDYIVVDKHIVELEGKLRALYGGNIHPGNPGHADYLDYPNFLAAFVQITIKYQLDNESHGVEEYWNYPMETLVLGVGDCEDTSILFLALLYAAGYGGAFVLLPGHAMASVKILESTPIDPLGKKYLHNGSYYGMVETTLDYGNTGKVGDEEDSAMAKAVHHFFTGHVLDYV